MPRTQQLCYWECHIVITTAVNGEECLAVNSNYTVGIVSSQHCLSVCVVCVEWACGRGIVMWTKMVGRRQRGYCGIAQQLAASTGIVAGYKIHSYNAILRGDSSLIVTIQMCTMHCASIAQTWLRMLSSSVTVLSLYVYIISKITWESTTKHLGQK